MPSRVIQRKDSEKTPKNFPIRGFENKCDNCEFLANKCEILCPIIAKGGLSWSYVRRGNSRVRMEIGPEVLVENSQRGYFVKIKYSMINSIKN